MASFIWSKGMTITIDIPRAAESAVAEDAARGGVAIGELVRQLIEERYAGSPPRDDWERLLLSGGVATGASLSDEETSREHIYED
jgi:hypothetical protein